MNNSKYARRFFFGASLMALSLTVAAAEPKAADAKPVPAAVVAAKVTPPAPVKAAEAKPVPVTAAVATAKVAPPAPVKAAEVKPVPVKTESAPVARTPGQKNYRLSDSDLAHKLAGNGRRRAEQFSWSDHVQKLLELASGLSGTSRGADAAA